MTLWRGSEKRLAPVPTSSTARVLATIVAVSAAVAVGTVGCQTPSGVGGRAASPARTPDVPYEPTPPEVVRAMLWIADVQAGDVVYDLGCGDGRIVIEAAKLGARGVGVDIDPQRIREARENARAAEVEDRVEFREGDLFATDLSQATVVTLYLLPEVNLRLRPKLLAQLRPGARVVSHWHDMGDWQPLKTIEVAGRPVYLWIIP